MPWIQGGAPCRSYATLAASTYIRSGSSPNQGPSCNIARAEGLQGRWDPSLGRRVAATPPGGRASTLDWYVPLVVFKTPCTHGRNRNRRGDRRHPPVQEPAEAGELFRAEPAGAAVGPGRGSSRTYQQDPAAVTRAPCWSRPNLAVAAQDAASLDRPCARRLRDGRSGRRTPAARSNQRTDLRGPLRIWLVLKKLVHLIRCPGRSSTGSAARG